ncbi:DUF3604 domain-containing protein [Robiginitalea aurantiaca]|uniref:DUF3604 domain-containing protein n=1 Tax=Robiginitalea aurantiaca TaxID=3056915 RepID=A0ABT7WB29_9FLAO|nr:DUF3604 domain-containing protein [Robiginitalea aurantiaca]MDM9630124.1 DUF3604 domain-containing protein [Robiginitalea aurantiaca]
MLIRFCNRLQKHGAGIPFRYATTLFALLLSISCQETAKTRDDAMEAADSVAETAEIEVTRYPLKKVFWGDTHHHTAISGDAFGGGTRMTPEDSYRMAIGEAVKTNSGQEFKMRRPLDFLCITDHAEGFGVFIEIDRGNEILMQDSIARRWNQMLKGGKEEAMQLAVEIPSALANNRLPEPVTNPETAIPLMQASWKDHTATAEKYNKPGEFTAFIAWEWTSVPTGNNLHRNVILRDDKTRADQIIPFSALQSEDAEKLWEFMESYEAKTGGKALAIPHNGNISGGLMFAPLTISGEPLNREYAEARSRWEPLFEVMQIKGASETHPSLSTEDEFADFGIQGWDNGNLTLDILQTPEQRKYQYARQAYLNGLEYEERFGANPYKFGLVGASDTHTGVPHHDEDMFWGKHATNEPMPERAMEVVKKLNGVSRYGYGYTSAGYTAVYAEANTRADLWDGMKRKEAYGTSGTRIELRVFGGFDFVTEDLGTILESGYGKGVPMGGDLKDAVAGKRIAFMIHAKKDPNWANLDRIQVVKGWLENGKKMEKVYDVAWSGDRKPDAKGKIASVGNTVDLTDGSFTNTIGEPELSVLWYDPDFDPELAAFYYVRVLEIPSPTWILYDKVKYGISDVADDAPLVQQERAWSSPIWYSPR